MARGFVRITLQCVMAGVLVLPWAAHAAVTWKPTADAMISPLDPRGPGLVVAVMQGDSLVYVHARGVANVATALPATADTVFRIGSLTKVVTAATVLRLADERKIDIDAALSNYLPTFPHADTITVRQLLSHTSGVSDKWDVPLTDVMDTAGHLKHIGATPLDFSPGTDFNYSNSGYMVLGPVIEKVTGLPWYDAETREVLGPLRMNHTLYADDARPVHQLASGYTQGENQGIRLAAPYSMTGPAAAGALISTAPDYARLLHGLAKDGLLKPDTFRAMTQPARIGDTPLPYGMGIVPDHLQGLDSLEHSGGIDGYTAYVVYLPTSDITVVALANSDAPAIAPRSLARRVAALAAGHPFRTFKPIAVSPTNLKALAGRYAIPGGGEHVIDIRNGTAWVRRDNGPARPLVAAEGDIFTYAGDGIDYIEARRDGRGAVTQLTFHPDGGTEGRREAREP